MLYRRCVRPTGESHRKCDHKVRRRYVFDSASGQLSHMPRLIRPRNWTIYRFESSWFFLYACYINMPTEHSFIDIYSFTLLRHYYCVYHFYYVLLSCACQLLINQYLIWSDLVTEWGLGPNTSNNKLLAPPPVVSTMMWLSGDKEFRWYVKPFWYNTGSWQYSPCYGTQVHRLIINLSYVWYP